METEKGIFNLDCSSSKRCFLLQQYAALWSLFAIQNLSAGVNLQLWHGSEHKGSLQDNWLSWHLCKMVGQVS